MSDNDKFAFSEGFTALARAKGKAVDRVLSDLANGASLGLTLAHVKGQARAKIISTMEQADILRLAKLVQSTVYDAPIQAICKSYNVAFTVFSEPGRGVSRSEWVKFGLTLKFASEEKTPKGNLTPAAKANLAAYERHCLIQETADALREAFLQSKTIQTIAA